ncbi:ATPase [Mahella australiensis]|uniref:Nuclease SbcCD subunit C n=1 Tax=Mahella australiensis (strain DSM 15567 / CIP 107919 / 50-1 BON) TaxID=697281 RepID=F4A1I0_MAHA5|nr:ATPase [Mahella australiensis]AEE96014.1 hypothetical protein Mahau_0816 [Mahella australiensis 50-1 BON]
MDANKQQLDDIKQLYRRAQDVYMTEKSKCDQLLAMRQQVQKQKEEAQKQLDILEKTRILLDHAADFARQQAKNQIERLVTSCLQFIFQSDIRFEIELSELRKRPEAEFYVISNYQGDTMKVRPQESRGGGVVDIISLAIRIAMLQSYNPPIAGPLVLDEPAKHVSEEYINNVSEFLKEISRTFGRQVIMVTHNRVLSEVADRIYTVDYDGSTSKISISDY